MKRLALPIFILALFPAFAESGPGIRFVENRNQWPSPFLFGAEFSEARIYLKKKSIYVMHIGEERCIGKSQAPPRTGFQEDVHQHGADLALSTFEMEFLHSRTPTLTTGAPQKTLYNYYLGNDKRRWGSGARSFLHVVYDEVYDGIDLKMYSTSDQVKYDWIISPCADPRAIQLAYRGVEGLEIVGKRLVVTTKIGEIIEARPYAYQIINGSTRAVACEFHLVDGTVGFTFPEGYDPSYELVIDPMLIFSSYSGSKLDNWGNTATPDSRGNLYSGGMVSGNGSQAGFPVTPGAYQMLHKSGSNWDIGILKYDSVGANLLYVTYLGGTGTETPQSLVVNGNDELLVLGATGSSNFPVTTGPGFQGGPLITPLQGITYTAGTDLFIARLSENGTALLASTLLGGTGSDGINFISGQMDGGSAYLESPLARNYGDQLRGDILADEAGNVFIATNTLSADFPVVNSDPHAAYHGAHDAVVAKLSPDLSTILWSRLIGGAGTDIAYSVKISDSGHIFAAGGTTSNNLHGMNGFLTTAGGQGDGWIVEISPDGTQILNGTYVGTTSYDQVYFIDIGTNDDVYAYGQTMGNKAAFPPGSVFVNPSSGQFIHCFKPDLHAQVFYTTIGNGGRSPNISPTAFLVNDCNNIYLAGWGGAINNPDYFANMHTNYVGGSTFNLPVTPDAHQKNTVQGNDFYLMVLSENARDLVYATYLGGTASLTHVDGGTSRFDKRGVVYHAVCASCGFANDFPAFNVPPDRSVNGSQRCNNAAFKFDLSALRAKIQTNDVALKNPGYSRVCMPDAIVFQNLSINGQRFDWDLGDGTILTKVDREDLPHVYKKPGTYTVKLKTIDHSTCIGEDSTTTVVEVFTPNIEISEDQQICSGSSVRLSATGGVTYAWRSHDGKYSSSAAQPLVSPDDTTRYFVSVTDVGGCVKKDTVTVDVVPGIDLAFEVTRILSCDSRPDVSVRNLTEMKEGEEVQFLFGDGTVLNELEGIHSYGKDGIYTISLRGVKEFCVYEEKKEVPVITTRVPNVITPMVRDGLNDTFAITYGDPARDKSGLSLSLTIVNRWGKEVFKTNDYREDWSAEDADGGVYYYEMEINNELICKGWVHVIK